MDHQRQKSRQDNSSSYFAPVVSAIDEPEGRHVEHVTYDYDGTANTV